MNNRSDSYFARKSMPSFTVRLLFICLSSIFFSQSGSTLDCPQMPWTGAGAEVLVGDKSRTECGDIQQQGFCARQIVVDNSGCSHCDSHILIPGNFSLLGSIMCNSRYYDNCSIIIVGSVDIGCCGSLNTVKQITTKKNSLISIGNNSVFAITTLEVSERGSLIIGDQTIFDGRTDCSVVVSENSSFALYSNDGPIFINAQETMINVLDGSQFNLSGIINLILHKIV